MHTVPPFIPSSPVDSCSSLGGPGKHLHFGKDWFWGRRSQQCPVNRAHYSCGIGVRSECHQEEPSAGPLFSPRLATRTGGISGAGKWQGHPDISRWGEQEVWQQAGSYVPSPLLRWSPLDNCSDCILSALQSSAPQPCLHVALQSGVHRSSTQPHLTTCPPHLLML